MQYLNFCYYLLLLSFLSSCLSGDKETTSVAKIQHHLLLQCDSLSNALTQLLNGTYKEEPLTALQKKFSKARYHYKQLEPFTELYFPGFSDAINGPAIDEEESYEGKVIEATGFQVVEEYLYSDQETLNYNDLRRETQLLNAMTNRLKQLIDGNELTDQHIFQATRLALLRMMALGVSGFDSPVALQSLPEAQATLLGIEKVLLAYQDGDSKDFKDVQSEISSAVQYLSENKTFITFNRAKFITDYISPLSISVYNFQRALGIANRDFISAVNLNQPDFFNEASYQMEFFANPSNRKTSKEMIKLGRILFFDPILSGNNRRACASCHNPKKAFADGRQKSLAFESGGVVRRNAPSLINAAYQRMQFYDSRIMFQEDQVMDVMANPTEMHGHIEDAVKKIKRSEEYSVLFQRAFGDSVISNKAIQKSLAAYVRSLSSMNSDFDEYMRGDKSKLSPEAVAGFNLFMGKAKCGTCHFMPFFNGTIPPMFTKSESEVLGVPQSPDTSNANIDPDLGKFDVYGGGLNKHAFKTPTIRNAALTAPYMHNGVYETLEQVIDFYNRGGGAGIGVSLLNQMLPPDSLQLTKAEKKNIIAFIHSLSDTTGLTKVPSRLPSFKDRNLSNRVIGGVY